MRILFTADWHIKLDQKNVPRDWQISRYRMLFDKVLSYSNSVDQIIIGGDIFDKMPTMSELSLFFEFVLRARNSEALIIVYDGNHEATKKGHTFLHELTDTVYAASNGRISIAFGICNSDDYDIIPYTHIKNFNTKDFYHKVLFTHVRGEIPPHVQPEIDLSLLDRWDVVLAGDLHAYSNSQRNILYPGSPLSTSFHRNPIKNGIILFDTETLEHEWIDLGLPQLIRKTIEDPKDAIPTDYDHTVYEIVGNIQDLSNIENKNIEKKIVSREVNKSLDLTNKTVAEELELYLREIQDLSDDSISDIMKVFHEEYNDSI